MLAKDDIIIRRSILHILDTIHGKCTLSDLLLDPGPDLYEFIRSHIYKILTSDDTKNGEFNPDTSPIFKILEKWDESDDDSFIKTSRDIANQLYNCIAEGTDIPAGDLLVVSFQAKGVIYLALLKMNYKECYAHEIVSADPTEALTNIKKTATLPSSSMIPEAVIINLSDKSIKLLEKRFDINGEKVFYLSENFLICHTNLPAKKKFSILTKVINNISNKYDETDLKIKMDTKSALQKEYVDNKSFDVEKIGNTLFGNSPEKKAEFDQKMEKYDLQYDNFSVVNETTAKKLEKQVLITDTGIQISIPMEVYNKLANIDVETDFSGKSTITIRNIENLFLK